MPPFQRFLALEDTHNLSVMCLGQEFACSLLEGAECAHCGCYPMRSSIRICPSSQEMSDKCSHLMVRVPLLPKHSKDSDRGICGFKTLFLRYQIPRIALESSSALGDVCLRVWILTLDGMFCFRICLSEEHAHLELPVHRDGSRCIGSARVCSYSRGMRNKAFVFSDVVPPLPLPQFLTLRS